MRKANIIIIMFLMFVCINAHKVNAKEMTATVNRVNGDTVTVVTDKGSTWAFYGDGFKRGDRVVCTVAKGNRIVDAHKLSDRQLVCSGANLRLVKSYCRKHFSKRKIKFVDGNKFNFQKRKSKRFVYVERIVSRSKGRYGLTADGGYIRYNIKVSKGKRVVSYAIWNPRNNICDDVVAVVDNGRIR